MIQQLTQNLLLLRKSYDLQKIFTVSKSKNIHNKTFFCSFLQAERNSKLEQVSTVVKEDD
jgi:hypothetical protein